MTSTDNFPHDDEHKLGSDEGDWVSSEPPVDDFDDSSAETATVSEGEEHPQEEAAPVAEEERRKFPLLLLIGAVGTLAAVGGVAFWQFGSHGQEQTSLLDLAAQNNAPQAAIPDFASKPLAPAATPSAPAASATVAPTTSFSAPSATTDIANAVKVPAQQGGAATPALGAASATLSPPSAVVANALVPAPALAPASTSAPAQISAQTNVAADARLTALSARIDDLQKSLGQATQQLGQINDKLTATQTTSTAAVAAATTQNDQATEDRLNKLEQKLLQVEQHTVTKAAPVASADDVFPAQTSRKYSHKTAHAKVARTKAHASVSSKWVLRAATPNEAWVATGSETRDLRPVHVGDALSGIGKVTAIQQVGDGWEVRGSSGVIR